jgi:hypothetical protein
MFPRKGKPHKSKTLVNRARVSATAVIALSLAAGAVAAVDSMLGARRCEKWAIIRSQIRE